MLGIGYSREGGVKRLRGLCRFDNPVESCANIEVVCERAAERMASRILVSSFLAIISAAFPLGQRIIGTWPGHIGVLRPMPQQSEWTHLPMVATTLNKPLAIRSISSSICCSLVDGELRSTYVE